MPTVVVTGATGAIGSATVAALVKRRAQVVSLSRPALDLSSMASVRAAARELNRTVRHIDALLNIAAMYSTTYRKNGDAIELMLATNHLGPFLLTNLLRDHLSGGGRVITVTAPSGTHAGTTGWFFKGTRQIDAPKSTLDTDQQSELWKRSAELVELENGF